MLDSLWVRSGLAIVLALRDAPDGLSPAQLARTTGFARTTLWESLRRLEDAGLVFSDQPREERSVKRVVTWRLDPVALNAAVDQVDRHLRTPGSRP